MPFNVTLYAWKPSEDWRAKKPPMMIVPPHRLSYKSHEFYDPSRVERGGQALNLAILANSYTWSTSDMAQVFGGTWQAWRMFTDHKKREYPDWSDEDLALFWKMRLWAGMYPLAWFQNG